MLKASYKTKEEIPAELQHLYTQVDGAGDFVLQVEGMVPAARLAEFRNNNIALTKELDTLKAKVADFGEYTPEQVSGFKDRIAELEAQIRDPKAIDDAVARRTQKMQEDHQRALQALQKRAETAEGLANTYKGDLDGIFVEREILTAAGKAGVLEGAQVDLLNRAKQIWRRTDDGKLVAMKGDEQVYGKNAVDPLTVQEWLTGVADEAPYLFKPSSGGGGQGGKPGPGGRVINRNDTAALGASLEDIAAGKVAVI